jgi:hypothetical protein
MILHDVPELNAFLESLGPIYVRMWGFRATHTRLQLLLTPAGFRALAYVYLNECSHVSGPTVGGPWRLQVRESQRAGGKCVVLFSENNEFSADAFGIDIEPADGKPVPAE